MLDDIDLKIIGSLQNDSSRTVSQVADSVGLSVSACSRRISILEQKKIVIGYQAQINGDALGFGMTFFVEVSLESQAESALEAFETAAMKAPEVLECYLMTGTADYLVKVCARDTDEYEKTYRRVISSLPFVSRIQTALVMKTVKPWSGYLTSTSRA